MPMCRHCAASHETMCRHGATASERKDIEHGNDAAGEQDAQQLCSGTVLKHVPEPFGTSSCHGTITAIRLGEVAIQIMECGSCSCCRCDQNMRPLEWNCPAHCHRDCYRALLWAQCEAAGK